MGISGNHTQFLFPVRSGLDVGRAALMGLTNAAPGMSSPFRWRHSRAGDEVPGGMRG